MKRSWKVIQFIVIMVPQLISFERCGQEGGLAIINKCTDIIKLVGVTF